MDDSPNEKHGGHPLAVALVVAWVLGLVFGDTPERTFAYGVIATLAVFGCALYYRVMRAMYRAWFKS